MVESHRFFGSSLMVEAHRFFRSRLYGRDTPLKAVLICGDIFILCDKQKSMADIKTKSIACHEGSNAFVLIENKKINHKHIRSL